MFHTLRKGHGELSSGTRVRLIESLNRGKFTRISATVPKVEDRSWHDDKGKQKHQVTVVGTREVEMIIPTADLVAHQERS